MNQTVLLSLFFVRLTVKVTGEEPVYQRKNWGFSAMGGTGEGKMQGGRAKERVQPGVPHHSMLLRAEF